MKNWICILLIALSVYSSGCASEKDNLKLHNIIEDDAETRARKIARQEEKLKDAERKKAEEIQAKKREAAEERGRTRQILAQMLAVSQADPPELAFLAFTPDFNLVTPEEAKDFLFLQKDLYPGLMPAWRYKDSELRIFTAVTPLNSPSFSGMSKQEFKSKLAADAARYDVFYRENRGAAGASLKVEELEQLIYVKIESRFLKDGEWWTDKRYNLFYSPSYALNIAASGPDSEWAETGEGIDISISILIQRLADYFEKGIPFKTDSPETSQVKAPETKE